MSTIGITVPVGSMTALAIATRFLGEIAEQNQTILEELGQGPYFLGESVLEIDPSKTQITNVVVPPAQGAQTPPPPSGDVQLDKDGLPWDKRIHSDAAEKLAATGFWKRRRNVADSAYDAVVAELRAQYPAPVAPPATSTPPATPPAPTPAPPPPVTAPAPAPTPEPVKVLVGLDGFDIAAHKAVGWTEQQMLDHGKVEWQVQSAPAAPAPGKDDPTSWDELVGSGSTLGWLMRMANAGHDVGPEKVDAAAKAVGLSMAPELQTRADVIPAFIAELRKLGGF